MSRHGTYDLHLGFIPDDDCIDEKTQMTNGDRIRTMSDEELTEFLLNRDLDVLEKASKAAGFTYEVDREQCFVEVIDWLKQEVEE